MLVAGRDRVAVDATCCRIMEIDPFRIEYLKLAATGESQIAEAGIRQVGEEVQAVATRFDLIPEFSRIRLEKV